MPRCTNSCMAPTSQAQRRRRRWRRQYLECPAGDCGSRARSGPPRSTRSGSVIGMHVYDTRAAGRTGDPFVRLPTIAAAGSSATRERMYLLPRPRLEFLLHRPYLSARGATHFSAVGRYPRSGDLPAALYQPSATEGTMSGTSAFTARLGNRLAGFDGQHGVHAHERRTCRLRRD